MNVKEMHYDFRMKFNKIDSQQNRNFTIPEVDWMLNEAQELFIKMVAEPRVKNHLGFETNQRSVDDIRTIVIEDYPILVSNNICALPDNYLFFIKAEIDITKQPCGTVRGRLYIRQHDDEFEKSPFDKSSFEWREVNGTFYEEGIKLYTDGTFTNNKLFLTYIKVPKYIHYAEGFHGGQYIDLEGNILTGSQNCELAVHTHKEIVDIAVAISSGQIDLPNYQTRLNKLSFNQLK